MVKKDEEIPRLFYVLTVLFHSVFCLCQGMRFSYCYYRVCSDAAQRSFCFFELTVIPPYNAVLFHDIAVRCLEDQR